MRILVSWNKRVIYGKYTFDDLDLLTAATGDIYNIRE